GVARLVCRVVGPLSSTPLEAVKRPVNTKVSRSSSSCYWLKGAGPRLRMGSPQARVPSAPATAWERPEALRQGVTPCQESVGDGNLAPLRDPQLLAEDVAVRLDRSGRDAELPSDLLVRVAGGDELDDLDLAFGE